MASANKVRQGQVWTAKVSGKPVQVEILGEAGSTTASGRKKFQFKNLSTGRTAVGTAGKLKALVSDGSSSGSPAPTPPPSLAPKRSAPKRPAPSRPFTPAAAFQSPPPSAAPAPAFRPFTPPPKPTMRENGSPLPTFSPLLMPKTTTRAVSPLGSLRGASFDPSPRPALSNPSRYPSEAARSAAEALSASSATDPDQVMAVMQAWYQRMAAEAMHAESMQRYYPPFFPY